MLCDFEHMTVSFRNTDKFRFKLREVCDLFDRFERKLNSATNSHVSRLY